MRKKKIKYKKCSYCKKDIIGVEPIDVYYDGFVELFGHLYPTEKYRFLHPWCDKLSDFRHYSKEVRKYEVKIAKEGYKEWKIKREKRRWLGEMKCSNCGDLKQILPRGIKIPLDMKEGMKFLRDCPKCKELEEAP